MHQKHLVIRRQNITNSSQFKYLVSWHQHTHLSIYSSNVLRYSIRFRTLFRFLLLIAWTTQLQNFNRKRIFQTRTSLQSQIRKVSIDCLLRALQILRICRKLKSKLFFSSWKFMKCTRSKVISMFFRHIVFSRSEETNEIDRKSRTNSHCKETSKIICMQTLLNEIF